MASRTTVDGTPGRGRCALDHGDRFDNQHLALDQAGGDGVSGPREDARICLPRHTHALGRGILIEPFQIGKTDRLEFVQPDGNGVRLARQAPDRSETLPLQLATDATRDNRTGHAVESICS
jgi:hypothetical protein